MSTVAPPAAQPAAAAPVFVAGSTGYIGSRLIPRLLDAGYSVRSVARSPKKLASRAWASDPRVTLVEGDLECPHDMRPLMAGCVAAYYLLHSTVSDTADHATRDGDLARSFATAAAEAGVPRIIYLGPLAETLAPAGRSGSSLVDVGSILASTSVATTVFRASLIIGSGSVAFEILRDMVARPLPWLAPTWMRTPVQPIAVRDVLHYLVTCLDSPLTVARTLDLGGPETVTFVELMRATAEVCSEPKRPVVPIPASLRRWSTFWLDLTTSASRAAARTLTEGLRQPLLCREDDARFLMPQALLTPREALRAAIKSVEDGVVESFWSAAGAVPDDPDWSDPKTLKDDRTVVVEAHPEDVFRAVCRIGGANGWYVAHWLWTIRGWMDELVGGPGLKRGRRHPDAVEFGEVLDFWRVADVEPARRLRLRAEMKVPGEALLEFTIDTLHVPPAGQPGAARPRCQLRQTALFLPDGLAGYAYWYSILPFHGWIFRGMLKGIASAAEGMTAERTSERTAEAPDTNQKM